MYQSHQRKNEVNRCVQITIRSAQQTLIDAEMGVQCVGDVSRLMIGMTLHGTKSPGWCACGRCGVQAQWVELTHANDRGEESRHDSPRVSVQLRLVAQLGTVGI